MKSNFAFEKPATARATFRADDCCQVQRSNAAGFKLQTLNYLQSTAAIITLKKKRRGFDGLAIKRSFY